MQRDELDKKKKKMQAEIEVCRAGYAEASNHVNVLRLQIEQMEGEQKKCYDKLNTADQRLLSFIIPFMNRYGESILSMHRGIKSEDVDARLKSLREGLQDKIKALVEEQTTAFIQFQNDAIKSQVLLDTERKRNNGLQKRLDGLEKKFDNLVKSQSTAAPENTQERQKLDAKLAETNSKLDQLTEKINNITKYTVSSGALSTALTQLDVNISTPTTISIADQRGFTIDAGTSTRRRINALADDITKLKLSLQDESTDKPPALLNLQKSVDSCLELVNRHLEKHTTISEGAEATNQLALAPSNSTGAASPPDQLTVKNRKEICDILYEKLETLSVSLSDKMDSILHEN